MDMDTLPDLIRQTAVVFGLIDIHEADALNSVRQTAFSWTLSPGTVCLASNKKYYKQAIENPNVVAIIAPPTATMELIPGKSVVIAKNAADLFYTLHNMALHTMVGLKETLIPRRIAENARIAETAVIGEHVVIGNNVVIDHGCTILDHTEIDDGTAIGPNCTIGVDGFFSKRIKGHKEHLQHYGGVRIGRGCKLHSGITVARSVNYSEHTIVKDNVHIGHKAIIGHDCCIGQGTDISVMALVAGRASIGKDCWIGANASVSNACRIGDGAAVRIGAVVITDIPADTEVSGNFAIPHRKNMSRYLKERNR